MNENLENKDDKGVKGAGKAVKTKQIEATVPNTTKKVATDAEGLKIAKMHGVSELFRNSRGEYFTREDYALLSEKGKKENLIAIKAR